MHQSHTKSFEMRHLVQTSFRPVLVEQKEQQKTSAARSLKRQNDEAHLSKTSSAQQED